MSSKLHLVYATDERYLFPTLVAAGSAILHASRPQDLIIDVLDCGVANTVWAGFERQLRGSLGNKFSLVRHKIDMSAYVNMAQWHTSKGIYSRLEIPQILHEVDWCVYADGDTLFTDDPFKLERIWNPTFAIMGHHDYVNGISNHESQRQWHRDHNLPWNDETHICAGFILLNLNWFRDNDATHKCFDFIKKYAPPYNDQDALNVICMGKIGLLPNQWGTFTMFADAEGEPGCFHYVGMRPWELDWRKRLPLMSVSYIWYATMRKVCGLLPWRYNRILLVYIFAFVKSALWGSVYKTLNRLPIVKGRYDGVDHILWPRKSISKFLVFNHNQ